MDPTTAPSVFTVTAQGGAGFTRKQARGRDFVKTSRGVRVRAEEVGDPDMMAAATLLGSREDAVLADLSAAEVWDLPLPPWIVLAERPTSRSIAVPADEARPKTQGVRGRRLDLPDGHVVRLRGLRVTSPARTWLDCAALIPYGHLVAMGDVVLRRHLASASELDSVVRWARRRRGVINARKALKVLDGRSESPGESLTRVCLLEGGIPAPVCNLDITVDGEWFARADLAWVLERVIVEYDGAVHLSEESRRRDAARRNLLQQAGWLVIVFTARDLKHPEAMRAMVSMALRSRGSTPTPR